MSLQTPIPEAPSSAPANAGERASLWLLSIAALLQLLPIWSVDYLPTQDGQVHIYLAQVLGALSVGTGSAAAELFAVNWGWHPNWFVYLAAQPLLTVLGPAAVEKVLTSAFLLLWPVACVFALRPVARFPMFGAMMLLPLGLSELFFTGFYNYCFALAFMMVGLGCWLRAVSTGHARYLALLFVVSLLAFFTHLYPTIFLFLFIGVGAVLHAAFQATSARAELGFWPFMRHTARRRFVPLVVALLPVFLLIVWFIVRNVGGDGGIGFRFDVVGYRVARIVSMTFNVAFSRFDGLLALLILPVVYLGVLQALRSRVEGESRDYARAFGCLFVLFCALLLAMPATVAQASFITPRTLPMIYIALVFWLVTGWRNVPGPALARIGLCLLLIGAPFYRLYQFNQLGGLLQEFDKAGARMRPHSTLLSIAARRFADSDGGAFWHPLFKVKPTMHISARLAAERGLIDLKLVQANFPFTPVVYRADRNPFWYLPAGRPSYPAKSASRRREVALVEQPPQDLDFQGYERRTGVAIDYLLLWGDVDAYWAEPGNETMKARINAAFEPVQDVNSTVLQLFRRRPGQS